MPSDSFWDGRELLITYSRWRILGPLLPLAAVAATAGAFMLWLWMVSLSTGLSTWWALILALVYLALGAGQLVLGLLLPRSTVRMTSDGIHYKQALRAEFYVPWTAVWRISARKRFGLLVEVDPAYWRYLGRRPNWRWLASMALTAPAGYANMIASLTPKGMSLSEVLRCARALAPGEISVDAMAP
jgi:hypothetical protein